MTEPAAPHMNALAEHRSGGTPRGQQARAEARRASGWAYAATLAAFSWWFCAWLDFPKFYAAMVAVLAVLPWCALLIVARWRGIVHTDSGGVYHGVAALFHAPSLLLCLSAMMDVHLLAWWQTLPMIVPAGAAVALLAVKLDRRLTRRLRALSGTALVAFAYAYGVVAEADSLLDRSPPQYFAVPVLDKHIAGGGRSPIRRYLTVAPWGPRAEADDIAVNGATFRDARRGEKICIALSRGALGLPWYVASACD